MEAWEGLLVPMARASYRRLLHLDQENDLSHVVLNEHLRFSLFSHAKAQFSLCLVSMNGIDMCYRTMCCARPSAKSTL